MIKSVEITNFRSIEHDLIHLDRPITIIVGPNGVGKTNLLLALRFLKNSIAFGPTRAIQIAGGLDQVFRMKARRTRECTIKVTVKIPEKESVLSSFQVFNIGKLLEDLKGNVFSYEISLSYSSDEKKLVIKNEAIKEVINKNEFVLMDRKSIEKDGSVQEILNARLLISDWFPPIANPNKDDKSSRIAAVKYFLSTEIGSWDDYNLNPFSLRKSSDLLAIEDLKYDGSGLSSYLYRMNKSKSDSAYKIGRRANPEAWKELKNRYSLVLSFIEKIAFDEDISSTNVHLKIKELNSKTLHNAGQVSDGTLKFIALAARILAADYSLLGLEEVENCLHPKAIKELMSLIEDVSDEFETQFVITSHSETVLNVSSIDSILIAHRDSSGATSYKKPINQQTLEIELSDGGFGLGTYWGTHDGLDV